MVDEVPSRSLALLGLPHSLPAFFASFVLFRVLDIWKPLGARQAQALTGGLGVVGDEIIAGLASCSAFHLGEWGLHTMGWMK